MSRLLKAAWIHAASKVPEETTIKAMEEFYREIYAVNGITEINFPEHYPVSRPLDMVLRYLCFFAIVSILEFRLKKTLNLQNRCVEVVGCVRCEELASWEAVPEGARLEGQTDFCWICEQPQTLLFPFEMRGHQGVYNLEKKIYEAAVRGLIPVKGPMPVKFPLPNPHDPFSLKPGSISVLFPEKASEVEKSSSLTAAIAVACAAATQFNMKDQDLLANTVQINNFKK
ncbi:uncharacterized protein LOC110662529 [Hevea brasiliensis]|uniref:uncharacterized protein LOC110662529 n=1 Tax=Hevea brasiliensis TaxID=3981 RepID=UPI0025DDAF7F|nr:uncharacterized protein LOC110662529 [Hevea brasiliensis]